MTEVIEITIRLRYDYDLTTTYRARLLPFDAIRCEQKINMSIFRRSRVAVASQSNRNCDIGFTDSMMAAARAWNSLPPATVMIRHVNSLLLGFGERPKRASLPIVVSRLTGSRCRVSWTADSLTLQRSRYVFSLICVKCSFHIWIFEFWRTYCYFSVAVAITCPHFHRTCHLPLKFQFCLS